MEIRKPAYYDIFRCIASACPDSCCKDWAVVVDDISAEMYRCLPGELGDRLRHAMVEEDGDTILQLSQDGRCPMWRDDGLCRIQAQLGEKGLCHTCSQFPRLRHDYGDFIELGLELSCPEAARLIFSHPAELITTSAVGGEAPEYDAKVMDILLRSRQEILSFLKERSCSAPEALAVMLLYGYKVQNELDGGEIATFSPASSLAEARELAQPGDMCAILDFYKDLEILTNRWKLRLDHPQPVPWQSAFFSMAEYMVCRYWLQAVSDFDLIGRVKLIVISCLVVKTLGGNIEETAQLYSKEIENDADNIEAILDGAYTSPALADIGLLGLLLEDDK